jgi:hypothetical protein
VPYGECDLRAAGAGDSHEQRQIKEAAGAVLLGFVLEMPIEESGISTHGRAKFNVEMGLVKAHRVLDVITKQPFLVTKQKTLVPWDEVEKAFTVTRSAIHFWAEL